MGHLWIKTTNKWFKSLEHIPIYILIYNLSFKLLFLSIHLALIEPCNLLLVVSFGAIWRINNIKYKLYVVQKLKMSLGLFILLSKLFSKRHSLFAAQALCAKNKCIHLDNILGLLNVLLEFCLIIKGFITSCLCQANTP